MHSCHIWLSRLGTCVTSSTTRRSASTRRARRSCTCRRSTSPTALSSSRAVYVTPSWLCSSSARPPARMRTSDDGSLAVGAHMCISDGARMRNSCGVCMSTSDGSHRRMRQPLKCNACCYTCIHLIKNGHYYHMDIIIIFSVRSCRK